MNNQLQILEKVQEFVKQKFIDFEGSHDWYHIERVHRMAIFLQEQEGGNKFLIELSHVYPLVCQINVFIKFN